MLAGSEGFDGFTAKVCVVSTPASGRLFAGIFWLADWSAADPAGFADANVPSCGVGFAGETVELLAVFEAPHPILVRRRQTRKIFLLIFQRKVHTSPKFGEI